VPALAGQMPKGGKPQFLVATCWRGRLNGLLTSPRGDGPAAVGSGFSLRLTITDPVKAFFAALALLLACATLGGCNDVGANPPSADAQAQFARRDDANMAAATVAIVSVEGAPADLSARLNQSLAEAAAARRIAVVSSTKARYLVRGYLTASLIEGGAEIDLVWDVFTPDKQRVQRLSDAIAVRGSGDDAWAMIGDAALNSVAAKSADDLAAFLSNTPEAAPAAAALSYAQ
jgi:hypothetical protein